MKKLLGSLPARLVLGVLAGILVGLWAGGASAGGLGETVMQVILTVKNLLGSLISFCVPLIVIGFIAPSITRLKSNASRMLGLSLLLAYTSSVCCPPERASSSSPACPSSPLLKGCALRRSCCSSWRSPPSCR